MHAPCMPYKRSDQMTDCKKKLHIKHAGYKHHKQQMFSIIYNSAKLIIIHCKN